MYLYTYGSYVTDGNSSLNPGVSEVPGALLSLDGGVILVADSMDNLDHPASDGRSVHRLGNCCLIEHHL